MFIMIVIFILICAAILIVTSGVFNVPIGYAYVIERNGKYLRTANSGINTKIPLIDKIACKCSLKESFVIIDRQPIIPNDNKIIIIEGLITYCITDPKMFKYNMKNANVALNILTTNTLRNLLANYSSNEIIDGKADVSMTLLDILKKAGFDWGVDVIDVTYKICK